MPKGEFVFLTVEGKEMGAFVARPEKPNGGGMIVIQEAFGVTANMQDVTERFAKEGYLAISPELFHRTAPHRFVITYGDMNAAQPHMKEVTLQTMEADLSACYSWLRSQSIDRIGSIGFCMGGRASFIANATLDLKAAVSFYGGGIAQQALDRAKDQHGPILFFWGGLDKHILPEHREAVAVAMREAGKEFVNVEMSNAGHAFFNNDRPAYQPEAAREAWALAKEFLAVHLGVGGKRVN